MIQLVRPRGIVLAALLLVAAGVLAPARVQAEEQPLRPWSGDLPPDGGTALLVLTPSHARCSS